MAKKILLVIIVIFVILFIGYKKEVQEASPQWLLCNFNQEKYDAALKKYKQCLEKNKNAVYIVCPIDEPQKNGFFDTKIQYNLGRIVTYKFFGITLFESKKAYTKTCKDL